MYAPYLFDVHGRSFFYYPATGHICAWHTDEKEKPTPTAIAKPLAGISLAVSQACNMACTYCYAEDGTFGAKSRLMDKSVAFAAIDALFADTPEGQPVNLAFMGGEPLLNRKLVYQAVAYASQKSRQQKKPVTFSLTTNGALIKKEDIRLFQSYPFAVTVSLDGSEQNQNLLRPLRNGKNSYQTVVKNIAPLLATPEKCIVAARVTVTPQSEPVTTTFATLEKLGFQKIGIAPAVATPVAEAQLEAEHFQTLLVQMKQLGNAAKKALLVGEKPRFSNFISALKEIDQGKYRTHPCKAVREYVGVGADGHYYACHRFVNDTQAEMGDIHTGLADNGRTQWLANHAVESQASCQRCWARGLCGGGCYHEVRYRGRPHCDYIRAWLTYCLQSYVEIKALVPEFFGLEIA